MTIDPASHDHRAELLTRAADAIPVVALDASRVVARARADRRRRRTTAGAMFAAAAVVVAVALTAGVQGDDPPRSGTAEQTRDPGAVPAVPTGGTDVAPEAGDTSLDGTWAVRALVGRDGQSVLTGPYADALSMSFDDGVMRGSSGCNSVGGPYVQTGDGGADLTFPASDLGSSLVGCEEPPLVDRLLDVRHVTGSGDVRYLHAANWMIVAELRRR